MNILFAIKALDGIKGGAERVLVDISSGMAANGHKISVLSFDKKGGQSFYPLSADIPRICLEIGDINNRSGFGDTLSRLKAIRKTVKQEKPDVIIAFMHSMFIPVSIACIGLGIPIVASEHIVPAHYKNRRFEFALFMMSSFLIKKITVLSNTIKQTYPKFMQAKMIAIANPVGIPSTHTRAKEESSKVILNVGRLDPQKDQKTLITAFSMIANDNPDWSLRIIGDGELKEELANLISKYNLSDRILLAGTTSEINEEYKRADIFALSSRYESFGLATAEAMSHQLPVIGFADCPGTNELIIHQENGLLIDVKEREKSMADALQSLIDDQSLRAELGKNGLITAKKYELPVILAQWEEMLEKLI